MSTRILAPLAAAGAVALVVGVGSVGARGVADCVPERSRPVAANDDVAVYRVRPRERAVDFVRFIGCHRRSSKRRPLGINDPAIGGVALIRVAGRFAAYDARFCTRQACGGSVRVKDLRTGRTRSAADPPQSSFVTDLDVTASGTVVWVQADRGSDPRELVYEVRRLDARGEVVVDEGAGIAPDSLAVSGATAYWTKDGRPAAAGL